MADIYTKRFVAAQLNPVGDTVIWTVPADAVYVVRSVVLSNHEVAAQAARIYVSGGVPGTNYFLVASSLSAQSSIQVDVRQELHAGETLHLVNTTGTVSCLVSGYRFVSQP